MPGNDSSTRHTLKTWILALGIGAAAIPAWSATPAPLPLDSYHDQRFDIRMERCIVESVAACTITVTAKVNSLWDMSQENRLMDANGVPTRAVAMTMGGVTSSVPSRNSQPLVAGIPTKIDIEFASKVNPNDVQFLVVYVGHWSERTITLRTNWVKDPG